MQIFFFLAEIRFVLMQAWNDFCMPIGPRPSLGTLQSEVQQQLFATKAC